MSVDLGHLYQPSQKAAFLNNAVYLAPRNKSEILNMLHLQLLNNVF